MKKADSGIYRKIALVMAFIFLWGSMGCSNPGEPDEAFRVGVVPAQNKGNMQKAMDKLKKVLSDHLGRAVEITV